MASSIPRSVMPADVAIPAVVGPVRHGPLRSFFADFFKNRAALLGVVILSLLVLGAIFADFVAPYSPIEQYRDFIRVPPSWYPGGSTRFLLGTDEVGRDILTRLIYGARISLFIGVSVVLV